MLKTFKYLKPYIFLIIIIFVLTAARAYLNLVLPQLQGEIMDVVVNPELTHDEITSSIWTNTMWMALATLGAVACVMVSGLFEAKVSSGYGQKLRSVVFDKIATFSNQEMDKFATSSLITRTTNDIAVIQQTVMFLLRMVVLVPFMAIFSIIMAVQISPQLSTILIFSVLAVFAVVGTVIAIILPKFRIIQRLIDRLNLVTRENLSGLKVVRAYNTEEFQAQKMKDAAYDNMKMGIFVNRVSGIIWPIMGAVMAITSAGIAYMAYSMNLLQTDGITIGDLSAILQYATQTIMSFMMITMIFMMLPRALVSARRVMEILECEPSIVDLPDAGEIPDEVLGKLVFKDVCFGYAGADENVLNNINFTAEPNTTTAIIGSTGTGKSTLVNLIPRFYDPTSGQILLDGVDIKEYKQDSYLKTIGFVPQKANLFKGTIRSNIAFGKLDITDEQVTKAAQIAQAEEFITHLEHGYDSPITQGGTNVSGGQRQRLSIARAIAKEPQIFIFDDSFSALDYKTDQALRKALKQNLNATIIVVAQRINTIRHADQIIVLDQGKICGHGKHEELMQNCQVYQEIAASQLSFEEAFNA